MKTEPTSEAVRSSDLLGVDLIRAERERQIAVEGWSEDHDDTHRDGALSAAAAHLIEQASEEGRVEVVSLAWQDHGWIKTLIENHGCDPVRCLTIAGALVAAEIDRLNRERRKTPNEKLKHGE